MNLHYCENIEYLLMLYCFLVEELVYWKYDLHLELKDIDQSCRSFCITKGAPHALPKLTSHIKLHVRAYPKVSRLAAWSKNCKWYSSLPLGAVVLLFCDSV
jgi:hypothetical protein